MERPAGFNQEFDREALVAGIEQANLNIARIQSVLNIQNQALQGYQQQLVLLRRTGTNAKRCEQLNSEIQHANKAVMEFHRAIRKETQRQAEYQTFVAYIDWQRQSGNVHVRPG
jgi:hypothetical protein